MPTRPTPTRPTPSGSAARDAAREAVPGSVPSLRLAPGAGVLRRDLDHLQVGRWPGTVCLLPEHPDVRRLLEDLRRGLPEGAPLTAREAGALARLRRARLVGSAGPELPAGLLDADAASAHRRHGRRAAARVEVVVCDEAAVSSSLAAGVASLMDASGVHGRGADVAGAVDSGAILEVLVSQGEPDRDAIDRRVAAGVPHLPVALLAGRVRLGPLTVPGLTACLRCVDAHRTDLDPRHPLLLAQPCPAPAVEPVLLALAAGWAAHEALAHVDGDHPTTWSTTIEVARTAASQEWGRHPQCPCTWGGRTVLGGRGTGSD
ncbi:hypothetical protein [Nocardioides sp. GY 10127]|uniref:hypothetical protein n=1 Tax=Nocardioides sp. GY 10127 TaxID=2569762 RepID=UPI0010A88A37|nr:hypothetical protein [Nocardioides sp. GY 10127]TIC84178.1 hypothetical protein E8D37_05100 [Nocardioides sp. GY 10127]